MNVVVEVGPLIANSYFMDSKTITEINFSTVANFPVVSNFSTISVISIGGTSISSITPDSNLLGVWAAA